MSRLAEIQEKREEGKISPDDVLYLAQREGVPGHDLPPSVVEKLGGEEELQEALYSNKGFGSKVGERAEQRRRRQTEPRDLEEEDAPEADGVEATEHEYPFDPKRRGDSTEEAEVKERTKEFAQQQEAKRRARDQKTQQRSRKSAEES